MKKETKKDAGFDGNQNQRQGGQVVQPKNSYEFNTDCKKMQGIIPVFSMVEETAESWNAKARRVNREAEMYSNWSHETTDEEDQLWRDELNEEEAELVQAWDEQEARGLLRLCQKRGVCDG